uniref:RNA pseudouridine synthase 5 n=1 Tax=Rhizophora mucronata TaxID=61149 RepID=A0A2P2KHP8_RHIMU
MRIWCGRPDSISIWTNVQFLSTFLSRTSTLLNAGLPEDEATYNPFATPGYRTIPIGCAIVNLSSLSEPFTSAR